MSNRRRIARLFRQKLRSAGQQFEEARTAYEEGRTTGRTDLPTDGEGNVRIVCRRYAEKRAVRLDAAGRPECFEGGHPDCEGCAEDVRDGRVETW